MNPTEVSTRGHLATHLTRLAHKSQSCILQLDPPADGHGSSVLIELSSGALTDAIPLEPPSLLEQTIHESGILSQRDLKRLTKQAEQEQWSLAELALAQGALPAEALSTAVVERVEALLGQMLAGGWIAHEVTDVPLDHPVPGLSQYFQLTLSMDELLLEAARRHGLWNHVRDCLSELKEVYGATPGAALYIDAGPEYAIHTALIQQFDGIQDLAQVIELSEQDPFQAWDVAMSLRDAGAIEAANPVQLFQIACDAENNGQYLTALRLFERAEQRGLDDFDLTYRLGELYHRNGHDDEAIERFMAFAEKCVGQYRIEDTIRSCRKIIDIDPDNMQVLERYVSLLARYGKRDEALHEGLLLARRFADADEPAKALTTLEKIFDLAEANEEVLRFYLDLCNRTGHEQGAVKAQRRLGNLFHQRADTKKALEFYQGLFCNGEDTPEVRSRLCELHFNAGNRDRAIEHLENLQRMPGWSPRQPDSEAADYMRRLLANGVREPTVTAWLADESRMRGARDETVRYLELHCQLLESAGNLDAARRAAAQLAGMDPRNLEAARRLSSLEMRTGRPKQAAYVLEQLAERLEHEGGHDDMMREVLEELVTIHPMSVNGREMLMARSEDEPPSPARSRNLLEMALLKIVMGEYARAEVLLDQLPEAESVRLHLYSLIGLLNRWHDRDQGGQWIVRAARLAAEQGERHTLSSHIEELKQTDPAHPELERLETILMNLPDPAMAARHRGPEKLQTKVSGITARLKSFKAGNPDGASNDDGDEDTATPRPSTVDQVTTVAPTRSGGTLKGLDALNRLRAGERSDNGETVVSKAAKKGVDALKKLRGGGAKTEEPPETPATTEPPQPAPSEPVASEPVSDAPPAEPASNAGATPSPDAGDPTVTRTGPPPSVADHKTSSKASKGVDALKKLRASKKSD